MLLRSQQQASCSCSSSRHAGAPSPAAPPRRSHHRIAAAAGRAPTTTAAGEVSTSGCSSQQQSGSRSAAGPTSLAPLAGGLPPLAQAHMPQLAACTPCMHIAARTRTHSCTRMHACMHARSRTHAHMHAQAWGCSRSGASVGLLAGCRPCNAPSSPERMRGDGGHNGELPG